ncbi:growth factor receptor-bound protein 2-like isoform X1 [Acanthaster planci]|uniref:Growth factor receptor-bound protein 2-like isoform X1 n=1 Tax=Acanthaster planci TaxID=133434 RepID=A0A8B7ZPS8_ACAPL|nr:growth factor receptor-bound protein 2-like isoform X1 [Acanthaster planci]
MCEAIALHDFNATADDELSFKKGSVVKIMRPSQEGEGWFVAEQDGKDGLVPKNYVQLKQNDFLEKKVTRLEAENLLKDDIDGAFLVRDSESTPGDFTLSVKFGNGVQHFKVLRDGAGKYFLWVVKFNSLNQLVDYHRTSSVSRTQTIYLKDRTSASKELYVEAAYDFAATEEGELDFKKGEKILVLDKSDQNWWRGRLESGKEGMFPVSYTKEIK